MCLAITVYDIVRLIAMTAVLVVIAGTKTNAIVSAGDFNKLSTIPFLSFAAALAIFPLMAFFLWQNVAVYRPFTNLYVAGKIIGIITVGIWVYFYKPMNTFFALFRLGMAKDAFMPLVIPLIALIDIVSILVLLGACRQKNVNMTAGCE
jgi:hypothetical protein